MSSSMNMKEAEEIAKRMTYRDAVNNALCGRCVPFKKATRIKLNELLNTLDKGLNVTEFADKKWISVSEWLPEKAFSCLVTVETYSIDGEPHRIIYPYIVSYDGKTWSDTYEGDLIPYDVIAWMPLPQPYTESEEKNG